MIGPLLTQRSGKPVQRPLRQTEQDAPDIKTALTCGNRQPRLRDLPLAVQGRVQEQDRHRRHHQKVALLDSTSRPGNRAWARGAGKSPVRVPVLSA